MSTNISFGGGGRDEAIEIMGEAIVGPWVRGLAAAGTLAEAGYEDDAAPSLTHGLLARPGSNARASPHT